jgi:hypothetical protein
MAKTRTRFFLLAVALSCAAIVSGQGPATSERKDAAQSRALEMRSTGNIPQLLANTKGDVRVECVEGTDQRVSMPPEGELATTACDSDLVLTAKAGAGAVHMTASKDFLYTDWNFVADDVLLDNPLRAVQSGDVIVVAHPGGELVVNGRKVTAACSRFRFANFEPNKEYLLFLKFLPESGTYKFWEPNGFELVGSRAIGLGERFRGAKWRAYNKDELLTLAKEAVRQAGVGCGGRGHR